MKKRMIAGLALATLALAGGVRAQEQLMKVKGGHELGETAEQFFSEGQEKVALDACASGNFKGVVKSIAHQIKKHCGEIADARRLAIAGKRENYQSVGEPSEMRQDTYTFEGGYLVKVELVYAMPSAESNYSGHSFEEIFSGTKQAYGPPTSETTKQTQDVYGVPYVAHRELWEAPHAAILITEQPGRGGSTTVVALTRAEYERTEAAGGVKLANPLE